MCLFLLYSKVTQLYTHIYPLFLGSIPTRVTECSPLCHAVDLSYLFDVL